MKKSGRYLRKDSLRVNPITEADKRVFMQNIKKSVISVLSDSENYSEFINDTKVVNSIADAVFASIYKRHGSFYKKKQSETFDDLVANIMFNTKKVKKVEDTKEQIKNAASIIASSDYEDTIKLGVLQASVYEKLDSESSKDLDFFESNFKNQVNDVVYAGSDVDLSNLPARKDLLYLDLILVAEGTNKNKDTIPGDELEAKYLTLIGMPLVEEHITDAIRGVFYDSSLIRIKEGNSPGNVKIVDKGGRLAVRAKAYVYKNRFPREAYVLKEKQSQGMLRYSVELAFGSSECSFCHSTFKPGEKPCEHLLMRHNIKGNEFSRIVRDIYFIGGAYTGNPAEKDAISLDVVDLADAKEEKNKKIKASCVNNTDNAGKEIVVSSSEEEADSNKKESEKLSRSHKGERRMFEFETVEELLANETVNALIESKLSDLVTEQKTVFASTIEDLESANAALEKKAEELVASMDEMSKKLEEANETIASMEQEKKVSDAIVDLQNSGYKFDSDDDLTAFADRIRSMSEEDAKFVIDLMKNQVVTAADDGVTTPTEESVEANVEEPSAEKPAVEDNKETLEASQNADVNPRSENSTIASIRKTWAKRLEDLTS